MTHAWLDEMSVGFSKNRLAWRALGADVMAATLGPYLGLDRSEALDARILSHALDTLMLTSVRVSPARRSQTFSWAEGGEGVEAWAMPVFDHTAEMIEVVVWDWEPGNPAIATYAEGLDHLGFDFWEGVPTRVLFGRVRPWLLHWVKQIRAHPGRLATQTGGPDCAGALILRPHRVNFAPVQTQVAEWARGAQSVVAADAEIGAVVRAAFEAAARNALPELKVVSQQGG